MQTGTHAYDDDGRNRDILVSVNGAMVRRDEARVSVFDSGFVLGDGVWEGIRLHNGRFAFLDAHLDRLFEGAKALDLDIGLTRDELTARLYGAVEANGMATDVHVRLMVSRGVKATPHQDPRLVLGPATVVIVPEYKRPATAVAEQGVRLFTAHVRRGPPDVQDPGINSHSKLNCILACIQAIKAGADEALMLDPHGFVATCNSTHFFIVRGGRVWTSTGRYCLAGITRSNILGVCRDNGIEAYERDFSLTDVYAADEAFLTGTFGGVTPAIEADGRTIGDGRPGPLTKRLGSLYAELVEAECPPLENPA